MADVDDCLGAPVLISTADNARQTVEFNAVPSIIGGLPPAKPYEDFRLTLAHPNDACGSMASVRDSPAAVMIQRGNCSFYDKSKAAQEAGASVAIIDNDRAGCFSMSANSTCPRLNITAISVSFASGAALRKMSESGMHVTIRMPHVKPFDASEVVLLLMAVGALVAGSVQSARELTAHLQAEMLVRKQTANIPAGERGTIVVASSASSTSSCSSNGSNVSTSLRGSVSCASRQPEHSSSGSPPNIRAATSVRIGDIQKVLTVTPTTALVLLAFVSCALVTMWLLVNWLHDLLTFLVVLAASIVAQPVMCQAALAALSAVWPPAAQRKVKMRGSAPFAAAYLVIVPSSVALAVLWFIHRSLSTAWMYQDLLGIACVVGVLRTTRISSFKSATLLLGAMLCYDGFFVFLQPLLTRSPSIMVEAAGGGSAQQPLPIVLMVPSFSHFNIKGYSILGFGDMLLPGVLAALCYSWDTVIWPRPLLAGHFIVALAAYVAGLCLTLLALTFSWFSSSGQPALVWVVPCMLLAVTASGLCHGELRVLWKGWDSLPVPAYIQKPLLEPDPDAEPAAISAGVEPL